MVEQHRRLGGARARALRLPRPVGAPRRVCHARPLPRLPSDRADDRAPQRRRDEPPAAADRRATFAQVADYESVTAPMYAWRHAVARDARTGNALNGIATVHAWRALGGGDDASGDDGAGGKRVATAAPLCARGAMRWSHGCACARSCAASRWRWPRSTAPASGRCARRSPLASCARRGLRAMGEVARASGWATPTWSSATLTARVRCASDDVGEWDRPPATPGGERGARLVNTGCWTYDSIFLTDTPGESPYWPGACVLVEDSGAADAAAPAARSHAHRAGASRRRQPD